MSNLSVQVVRVEDVRPHPNADRLELATVLGWQVVIQKDAWETGALGVYFPPDTLIPLEWAERFKVTNYCQVKPDAVKDDQFYERARIKQAKLRGEPSFGLLVPPANGVLMMAPPIGTDEVPTTEIALQTLVGRDVAEFYGAVKYVPPIKFSAGDALPDDPRFPTYTEIENLRNYPNVLMAGEPVWVTEKIHGTCCRVGIVEGELMAGSKGLRRKAPESNWAGNIYWFPWTIRGVHEMLRDLSREHPQVVLFGEVFGKGVQKFQYGQMGLAFRVFDLLLDGRYVDYPALRVLLAHYGVPMVPDLGTAPYSVEEIAKYAKGKNTIAGSHIREGVVIRPAIERYHPAVGRVVLKYVSDEYLLGNEEDFTDQ